MGRTRMGRTDVRTDGRTRRRLNAPLKFFGEHNKCLLVSIIMITKYKTIYPASHFVF